jgi:hypothetical protein
VGVAGRQLLVNLGLPVSFGCKYLLELSALPREKDMLSE